MSDIPVRLDPETHKRLKKLAYKYSRKMKAQIAVVVENAYRAEFDVVDVQELTRPFDSDHHIPDMYVQKHDPA